jgi:hypothetical protein
MIEEYPLIVGVSTFCSTNGKSARPANRLEKARPVVVGRQVACRARGQPAFRTSTIWSALMRPSCSEARMGKKMFSIRR